jgi:hypothetical protein
MRNLKMKQFISKKDLKYLADVAGTKITVKDILDNIKSLPQNKRTLLKKDFDECNDYILETFPDYYEEKIEPFRYSVGEEGFIKEIMKRI